MNWWKVSFKDGTYEDFREALADTAGEAEDSVKAYLVDHEDLPDVVITGVRMVTTA